MAQGRERSKKRLDAAVSLGLLGGIALALVPFDRIAIAGWQLAPALSEWLRAALLALGVGVAVAASEAENGYARARLAAIPVAALAAGGLVQLIFSQLMATGFAAFVAATSCAAWADNSAPVPDALKPRQRPADDNPLLARLAKRTAVWLSRYAQTATSTKRKEEP